MKKKLLGMIGLMLILGGCGGGAVTEEYSVEPVGMPAVEPDAEEKAAQLKEFIGNARESYEQLLQKAEDSDDQKLYSKVSQIEQKYRDRLAELEDMDPAKLSEDEIEELFLEVSTILSDIQEVKNQFE